MRLFKFQLSADLSQQVNLSKQTSYKADFGLKITIYLDIHETFFNFRPLSCQLMAAILDFSI